MKGRSIVISGSAIFGGLAGSLKKGFEKIVTEIQNEGIEFTISVPFERFAELKRMIQGRGRWRYFNDELFTGEKWGSNVAA